MNGTPGEPAAEGRGNWGVLHAGQELGPYRVLGPLGEGGMGKVYRGVDTRLDRSVAIKISAEQFSRRFEREARAISALNHPHICTLYDVGSLASGAGYMVTELVEGETLRDWLKRSPSLEQILHVARQVLEALRAAHAAGIIHRDLKPANIMIRFDGYVKVLDFGLAKRIPSSLAAGTEDTTVTELTAPGRVFGTIDYMSPEQVLGREVDARSDLFAFGTILYEMLAGQQPWRGSSGVDTMHAILHDEPPPLGGACSEVMKKLLQKKPAERYPSAEAALEALSGIGIPAVPSATIRQARKRTLLWRLAAVAAAIAAAVFAVIRLWPHDSPLRAADLRRVTADAGLTMQPALSRDGRGFHPPMVPYGRPKANICCLWVPNRIGCRRQRVSTGGSRRSTAARRSLPACSPPWSATTPSGLPLTFRLRES